MAQGQGRRAAAAVVCGLTIVSGGLAGCGGDSSTSRSVAQQIGPGVSTASRPTASTRPLVLHLDTGSYTTESPNLSLSGTATAGASVKIDGRFVALHDGRWRSALRPHLGANGIVVVATMPGHATVVKSITITRRRSAAELEARALARRETEARAAQRRETEARSHEAERAASCTNGTYVNAAGNTVCKPEESPTVPAGASARCADGTYSFSESRSGTCSHHGGVAEWLSG